MARVRAKLLKSMEQSVSNDGKGGSGKTRRSNWVRVTYDD